MDYVPGIALVVLDQSDRPRSTITGWLECSWQRRVDSLPSAGAFVLAPHTLAQVREIEAELRAYRKVRLSVDGVTRGTGYVSKMKKRGARDTTGPTLSIQVNGALNPALKSSIPDDFTPGVNQTIRDLVTDLFWTWGIEVVAGADADRLATDRRMTTRGVPWGQMTEGEQSAYLADHTDLARRIVSRGAAPINIPLIDWFKDNPAPRVARLSETKESRELHPHPDELIGAFLPRFLRGYGLVLMEGADGSAILTTPDYEVRPDRPRIEKRMTGGTIHEGTIIESDLTEDFARLGEVIVRGKRRKEGREMVAVSAFAQDPVLAADWGSMIRVSVTDPAIKDQQEAQRRADTMMRESMFGGYVFTAKLAGYAVGPKVIMRDQVIAVLDEEHDVDRDLYVVSEEVGFSQRGPSLAIECTLPGTWTGA